MRSLKGTAAHEIHLVATADRENTHSPAYGKRYWSGRGIGKSAFDRLLETDEEFYRLMSRKLADIPLRMSVPPFLIEDLVEEAWLSAVQHRDLFVGGDVKRRLTGFLRKVVHDKAVDLRRHLAPCPCQSLDEEKMELSDEAETQRAELVELHEWLEELLQEAGLGQQENKDLLRAHYFQGVTISELAKPLGITPDAVDSRIRRLVGKMREKAEQS